jgi:hypothetical protein
MPHRHSMPCTRMRMRRPRHSALLAAAAGRRQRSQNLNLNLTSASGDAIWGAHRPNYIHGQFGGLFFVPQVPPAPRCTPVVISTKLTSRLSLAPCCACQPPFGHIQAAPRRALAPPVESPPAGPALKAYRFGQKLLELLLHTKQSRGTMYTRGPALTRSRSRGYKRMNRFEASLRLLS